MITLALKDKTVEVSSVNSVKSSKGTYQLWATRKSDNTSFLVLESDKESVIEEYHEMINTAIQDGEYLVDVRW